MEFDSRKILSHLKTLLVVKDRELLSVLQGCSIIKRGEIHCRGRETNVSVNSHLSRPECNAVIWKNPSLLQSSSPPIHAMQQTCSLGAVARHCWKTKEIIYLVEVDKASVLSWTLSNCLFFLLSFSIDWGLIFKNWFGTDHNIQNFSF